LKKKIETSENGDNPETKKIETTKTNGGRARTTEISKVEPKSKIEKIDIMGMDFFQ